MKKTKEIRIIIYSALICLMFLLIGKTMANTNIEVSQEKREPVQVKITSDEEFNLVKIYKKAANGKYILIYKAELENVKSYNCQIPVVFLSTKENTEFIVVVENSSGRTGEQGLIVEPIPEPVPINPSETAEPSWSPSPIPTKPTMTPSPSPSGSTSPTTTPSTSPSTSPTSTPTPTPEPDDPNKVYKVLIIGNSYTYYHDLGGILAELGKATDKKMVVVWCGHGGKDAKWFATEELAAFYWDNRGEKTVVKEKTGKYDYNLKKVLAKDWAKLDRAGQWDYVFMLSRVNTKDKLDDNDKKEGVKDNKKVFDMVKGGLKDSKNFIIVATYFHEFSGADRAAVHIESARNNGFSVIPTYKYYEKYSSNWRKTMTIIDNARHPTATMQYFRATAMYAKMFGKDRLAKTEDATDFIKVYNKKGGQLKDVIAATKNSNHEGQTDTANSVTAAKAKKIQAIIYKYYDELCNFDVGNPDPKSVSFKKEISSMELNTYKTLEAVVSPATADYQLTWSTSNKNILKVNGKGEVHAVGKGSATITVKTQNGKSKSMTIKVKENGLTPKYEKATPNRIIEMKINKESPWQTAQGMGRIKANDGKYYLFCAVIKTSDYSDRNSAKTMIYIIDEETGKTVAKVRDYSFGHANGVTCTNSNILIYGNNKLYVLKKDYITEAIKAYKNNDKEIITSGFTSKYLSKTINVGNENNSLGYDSNHKQIYSSNLAELRSIKIDGNKATVKNVENIPHTKDEISASSYYNCGLAISGDYLLLGRYYKDGFKATINGKEGTYKNAIQVYKCTFDSDGVIKKVVYKKTVVIPTTITVDKGKPTERTIKSQEIESIEAIDNSGKIVAYYNSHFGDSTTNNIYYLDLKLE